jgi:energy-coupling factor transporter ATP-binding protein EcfA2
VAIACFPGLLLGDEPTSQLDHVARDRVISALQEVNRQTGMTIIVVTHDPAVAAALPRTVTIRDGRVRAEGRQGEEFAVVSADGSCPCRPPRSRPSRPGTLVRVHEDASGWRLLPQGVDPDEAVGAVSTASGMPLTSQALTGSLRTGREER